MLWTEEDVHFERIYPDESFRMENISRVKQFFNAAILPELMGKFYSRGSESGSIGCILTISIGDNLTKEEKENIFPA